MKPWVKFTVFFALAMPFLLSFSVQATNASLTIIKAEQVNWGYLNPLRGDKSPGAADLWGDRTKEQATGMLVRFNAGFASPPHIHNISYRGIVIKGLMHNDDPSAERLWMPSSSYWTQPAGENHITAASATTNLIYLEIDSGPYLVHPTKQQFDSGERPINVHASNIVWQGRNESILIKSDHAKIAHLWRAGGHLKSTGYLIKLSAGAKIGLTSQAAELKMVIIDGSVNYQSKEDPSANVLAPGSYISASGSMTHTLTTQEQAVIYLRTNKIFQIE